MLERENPSQSEAARAPARAASQAAENRVSKERRSPIEGGRAR
ncbi:MAG: hypothetical protein R2708_24050 [Vicinamibacterales bacterium]